MAQELKQENDKNDNNDKNDDRVSQMFIEYEKRIKKFEEEVCEFPVDSNRIISKEWKERQSQIYQHMTLCYPLVHGSVLSLANDFLLIKV